MAAIPTRRALCVRRARTASWPDGKRWLVIKKGIDALDEYGIYRSLTEHLAAEMGRWLIGPMFWYLVGGLSALLVYATIVAAVDALAADDKSRAGFGWTASRLEFMGGWLPGRIAGVLVVLASLLAPTARPIRAARIMVQMARSSPSPAHGWPAAAMAGALSLEIAGPNSTEGRKLPWIGGGSARATLLDAHRAPSIIRLCLRYEYRLYPRRCDRANFVAMRKA